MRAQALRARVRRQAQRRKRPAEERRLGFEWGELHECWRFIETEYVVHGRTFTRRKRLVESRLQKAWRLQADNPVDATAADNNIADGIDDAAAALRARDRADGAGRAQKYARGDYLQAQL